MPKSRTDAKFLLIQVRSDQFIKNHEAVCFRTAGGLRDDQLVTHDLLEKPLSEDPTFGFDGVLIGGVSDFLAADLFPNRYGLVQLVTLCREKKIPLLAACWGAQFLALQFGGSTMKGEDCSKIGSATAVLSEAGSADALFAGMPKEFTVSSGHNEHVVRLPEGAQLMAYSELCPIQAYKLTGTPVYGLQFHPEMDKRDALVRFEHRMADKPNAAAEIAAAEKRLQETPEARAIVARWVDLAIAEK